MGIGPIIMMPPALAPEEAFVKAEIATRIMPEKTSRNPANNNLIAIGEDPSLFLMSISEHFLQVQVAAEKQSEHADLPHLLQT